MRGAWLQESLAGEALTSPLSGSATVDVAIVGGGLTGLWCALHIRALRPSATVTVLEGDVCGGGASGRNAGFVLDWWPKLASFERVCGVDEARRLMGLAEEAIEATAAFCEQHAPRAKFTRAGWLWGATTAAELGSWAPVLELHRQRNVEIFREVDREEAQALSGSPRFLGGAFQQNTGMVQPAQLVSALKRVALERGVQIHEGSPVRRVERGKTVSLRTDSGELLASRVILATNCWLIGLKRVRRSMMVLGTDMASTEPVPDLLGDRFATGNGVTDSRVMLRFARATADRRLMVGRAGAAVMPGTRTSAAFVGSISAARAQELRRVYADLYPEQAALAPLTRSWTGPVDRSWDGLPFYDSDGPGGTVVWSGGYSGNGVGPSQVVARVLVSMALELDDDYTEVARLLPPRGGVPPEPLRYLGGQVVRRAISRKEARDGRGAQTGKINDWIASLAPSDGMHSRE